MKFIYSALIIVLLLSMTGCSENPLLGTWRAAEGQNSLMIICPEITFTSDLSTCGSLVEEVSYEIQDNLVIVSSDLASSLGMKVAYKILDDNTMSIDIPMVGRLVYVRDE